MDILEKIVLHKKQEVALQKEKVSIADLEKSPLFERETISLSKNLLAKEIGIIAEFKRKSPSKGFINENAAAETITLGYQQAGVAGISVLTDTQFFGGSFQDLQQARATTQVPILRKDFMIDEYQLWEAKALGADVILLIAACLEPKKLENLAKSARALGLEVLLEVHNQEELEQSINDYVNIVGVNNRNLKTFEVSVETSLHLAEKISSQFVKISESGLSKVEDILQLNQAGYRGFLIGETFMKTAQPAIACRQLIEELQQKQTV